MDLFRFVLHLILTWQQSILKETVKTLCHLVCKLQTQLLCRQTDAAADVALYPHLPSLCTLLAASPEMS